MGKEVKVKGITLKSGKKLRRIAKEKFAMSNEGIEKAANIGKIIGVAVIAFTIGRVTKKQDEDNEYAGKNTITAIGGQVSNNTTSTMIGEDAIVTKDGGVVIKKLVVNGAINVDMSK